MGQNIVEGEQVQVVESEVMSFGDRGLAEVAQQAEARVEAMKTIMRAALRFTHAGDWTDIGGRPYLNSSGAEKIANIGVTVDKISRSKFFDEDDDGRYYVWEYVGTFAIAGRSIESVGTCSSRDEFFAKREGAIVPLQHVDQTNIMKSAYSNLLVNGISRLLGLRNPSWEDLQTAGIDIKDVSKVEFGKGTKGGSVAGEPEMRREIDEKLRALSGGDPKVAETTLEMLTTFKGKDGKQVSGVRQTSRLKAKRLEIALEKVRAEYDRAQKEGDVPGSEPAPEGDVNDPEFWGEDKKS